MLESRPPPLGLPGGGPGGAEEERKAEEAAGEAGRRLLLVEQREAALAEAEAAQRCAEQQRVQPLGDDAVPPWLRTAPHLPPWTI